MIFTLFLSPSWIDVTPVNLGVKWLCIIKLIPFFWKWYNLFFVKRQKFYMLSPRKIF